MAETVRIEHEDALAKILSAVPRNAQLIRFEGFMGVGKTTFGRDVAQSLECAFIEGDEFVDKADEERAYIDCLRLEELRSSVQRALHERQVVFDAVCSKQVMPSISGVSEFSVYLKRMSFSAPNWPGWYVDPDIEDIPARALERSIYDYHLQFRPHKESDLILELPEQGFCLQGPLW